MANIRRGARAGSGSWARAGRITSSSGRDRATPAPRRNVRRETGRRVEAKAAVFMGRPSLGLEQLALDDGKDEGAETVSAGGGVVEDALHLRPVAEPDR